MVDGQQRKIVYAFILSINEKLSIVFLFYKLTLEKLHPNPILLISTDISDS